MEAPKVLRCGPAHTHLPFHTHTQNINGSSGQCSGIAQSHINISVLSLCLTAIIKLIRAVLRKGVCWTPTLLTGSSSVLNQLTGSLHLNRPGGQWQ